jgi:hypothetical protein
MKNVLVFPCGSEIALEVYNSLKDQKDINLIGGSGVEDNGKFVFDNYIGDIPMIHSDNFIPRIKEIVTQYEVDYIYPCIDIAIFEFKKHEKELNCRVIGSEFKTVDLVSMKSKTYDFFKNIIRVPEYVDISNNVIYPIFSKPDIGSSSRNTFLIWDDIDLLYCKKKYPDNLYLEYLPGDEYTVDCFTNKYGQLILCKPRERSRVINGISVNTKFVNDKKINEIAEKINNNLSFFGSWFFQLKKDKDGEYCLLEIASRFGGSSVINRILGVNFAYLNILMYDRDIDILSNDFDVEISRSLDIKVNYDSDYQTVYIDYDDTIIVNSKVNLEAMKFLYKCFNNKKKLILITKHKGNITESLLDHRISPLIFDRIIQIGNKEEKSDHISGEGSIFIDDSFSERKKVKLKNKIPVFSVENIKFI